MTIYENIQTVCKEKGLTVNKVENDLGIERSLLYKWQTVDPGSRRLKAVAEYLGVTVDRLLLDVPAWESSKKDN